MTTATEERTIDWYRSRSLWLDGALDGAQQRQALVGAERADVVIVGGGLMGMWTAYSLSLEAPHLKVVVLERDIVGFGAAGRNGGWVGAGIAGAPGRYAKRSGWDAVRAGAAAFRDAVVEIEQVTVTEGIDCGYVRGGTLAFAATTPQADRLKAGALAADKAGMSGPGDRMISVQEARDLVNVAEVHAAHFTPDCARVDPAKLVRGLATVAESRGVRIFEGSEVVGVEPHRVSTAAGAVEADRVILATEAWASQLPGGVLTTLPLTSMMIATEPLPQEVWDELGWPHGLTVRDKAHLFFYAQRTPDNRIAIGGRGAPYRLTKPYSEFGERDMPVWNRLERTLREHFPAARDAAITHRWGGILGVPRDWSMSIRSDERTGILRAGGLSGHGVIAAYIAGRTLADLVQGNDTERVRMPWVGHRSRRWEPEPARYFAANAIVQLLTSADKYENKTDRPAKRAKLVAPFMPPA